MFGYGASNINLEPLGERVVRLWYRLVNRLFRLRRLQRLWGHLGAFLRDQAWTRGFRQALLGSRLIRPGGADDWELLEGLEDQEDLEKQ